MRQRAAAAVAGAGVGAGMHREGRQGSGQSAQRQAVAAVGTAVVQLMVVRLTSRQSSPTSPLRPPQGSSPGSLQEQQQQAQPLSCSKPSL